MTAKPEYLLAKRPNAGQKMSLFTTYQRENFFLGRYKFFFLAYWIFGFENIQL